MSEYPRAWGLWHNPHRQWADPLCASRLNAEDCACSGDSIVELIPLPEHEAIVAAAVAAERERCAGIADAVEAETMPVNRSFRDHFEHERGDTAAEIASKIREVPK